MHRRGECSSVVTLSDLVLLSPLQSGTKLDAKTKLKFTSFFKNVVVELDKEAYGPDNHLAEWHSGANTEASDGFTVCGRSQCNTLCKASFFICLSSQGDTTR